MRGRKAPEGSTYVSANGYHYTKSGDAWRLTHHIIAEEHILGRPISENELVRFKTNNKANLHPDNIEVVIKGKQSLRRRKAQLEARIEELQAQLDQVNKEIEAQRELKV
jgi:argininosuccinate lyase